MWGSPRFFTMLPFCQNRSPSTTTTTTTPPHPPPPTIPTTHLASSEAGVVSMSSVAGEQEFSVETRPPLAASVLKGKKKEKQVCKFIKGLNWWWWWWWGCGAGGPHHSPSTQCLASGSLYLHPLSPLPLPPPSSSSSSFPQCHPPPLTAPSLLSSSSSSSHSLSHYRCSKRMKTPSTFQGSPAGFTNSLQPPSQTFPSAFFPLMTVWS